MMLILKSFRLYAALLYAELLQKRLERAVNRRCRRNAPLTDKAVVRLAVKCSHAKSSLAERERGFKTACALYGKK